MSALALWKPGSPLWKTSNLPAPDALSTFFETHPQLLSDPGAQLAFVSAVAKRLGDESTTLMQGVSAYVGHRTTHEPSPSEVIWSHGPAELLDFGPSEGQCVLLVPSLINRHTVLDLMPDASLVRSLIARGFRPLVLNWGDPIGEARGYDLGDYIDGILGRVLAHLAEATGNPVPMVGYCMGGTLALAAALRHPEHVARLALLATPWDFHADSGPVRSALISSRAVIEPMLENYGAAPVDLLQALFAALDPMLVGRKYRKFARMDKNGTAAEKFVVLEDWVNNGVELAGPVAQECLFEWYLENTPAQGRWKIDGRPITPEDLPCAALAIIPQTDRIVPPDSARALAKRIPDVTVQEVPLGHVGMMAGGKAKTLVHGPLADWLGG